MPPATAASSRICSAARSMTASRSRSSEREQRGETVETRFVSIDGADLIGAELRGKTAQVTVRFQSQLVSVTRDKDGAVIDGNPDKVTDVTDVWTFARDVIFARSQLETGRHRSRAMTSVRWRRSSWNWTIWRLCADPARRGERGAGRDAQSAEASRTRNTSRSSGNRSTAGPRTITTPRSPPS